MALPIDADIPLILSRIRLGAAWGWEGDGSNYSDPAHLDWSDQIQVEPTLQELEDEWTIIEAENADKDTVRQQLKDAYAPLAGLSIDALTNTQLKLLVEILVYVMGGIDQETRVLLPASQWNAAKEILGI